MKYLFYKWLMLKKIYKVGAVVIILSILGIVYGGRAEAFLGTFALLGIALNILAFWLDRFEHLVSEKDIVIKDSK